jgi:L-arginine dehydrogenase
MTKKASVHVLSAEQVDQYLANVNVVETMAQTFTALAEGLVVQPPQTLALFPQDRGDFITYLGALAHKNVFGSKLSPYIPTEGAPIITAWTTLMSMTTGQPLLLCDSAKLTQERTSGVTALAVDKLARADAQVLAVVGSGALAKAHIEKVLTLRAWSAIRVFSPSLAADSARSRRFTDIDGRVSVCDNVQQCVKHADVVMLCTSSGTPVVSLADIDRPALITSISTNVAKAHEIAPSALGAMDVYCDYKMTTPSSAGEMVLATQGHSWSAQSIVGDLADLCAGQCPQPAYDKPVFFRSIGLGIEDIAVAHAIYQQLEQHV